MKPKTLKRLALSWAVIMLVSYVIYFTNNDSLFLGMSVLFAVFSAEYSILAEIREGREDKE